jgi:hypothetical protein
MGESQSMLNFDTMIKETDRYHVYEGCYADLILGCGVAVSYVQLGDIIRSRAQFFESATINALDLCALHAGLSILPDGSPYTVHTNSKYVSTVLTNAGSWRNQKLLEEKAHSQLVNQILETTDQLGEGRIHVSVKQYSRDDVMMHLLKYSKHMYHRAQMEMISKLTTDLPSDLFTAELWQVKDMAGSILWKTPLSVSEFQKKIAKARMVFSNNRPNFLRLVK